MRRHEYNPARNPGWKGKCVYREGDTYCRELGSASVHIQHPHSHRITCPFEPHGGVVHVLADREGVLASESGLIEQHSMDFQAMRQYSTFQCPASLMHWPLNDASKAALAQQARDMAKLFQRDLEEEADQPNPPNVDQNYASSPKGFLHLECMTHHFPGQNCAGPSAHGPHGGRDTDHTHTPDSWALGGRADEDVIPHHQAKVGDIPSDTEGHHLGGNNMSIAETAGLAQRAINSTDEAYIALKTAEEAIIKAQGTVNYLAGDSPGETLMNWQTMLTQMHSTITVSMGTVPTANEFGRRFINNLYS